MRIDILNRHVGTIHLHHDPVGRCVVAGHFDVIQNDPTRVLANVDHVSPAAACAAAGFASTCPYGACPGASGVPGGVDADIDRVAGRSTRRPTDAEIGGAPGIPTTQNKAVPGLGIDGSAIPCTDLHSRQVCPRRRLAGAVIRVRTVGRDVEGGRLRQAGRQSRQQIAPSK